MRDLSALPEETTRVRAASKSGMWTFGSLITLSQELAQHQDSRQSGFGNGNYYVSALETSDPDLWNWLWGLKFCSGRLSFCREKAAQVLELPAGWEVEVLLHWNEERTVTYYGLALCARHNLELPKVDDSRFYSLVSGSLIRGENFTLGNLRNYQGGQELKFLPFTVNPEWYVYFMDFPEPGKITQAASDFAEALENVKSFETKLPKLLEEANWLTHFIPLMKASKHVKDAIQDVEGRCEDLIGPHKKQLARLYHHLPGPKDVVIFNPETKN